MIGLYVKMNSILKQISIYAADEKKSNTLMLADSKKELTYGEAWRLICSAAARIRELKFAKGSSVLIHCTQNCAFIVSILGVQLAGLVAVPLEKGASELRIDEIAADSKAVLAIGPAKLASYKLPFIDSESIYEEKEVPSDSEFSFPESGETAEILFSTGTTGKSKGIVITHGNNVAIAENISSGTSMKEGNIELIPMPLSHSHGLRTVYANVYAGNTCVFVNGVLMIKLLFNMLDKYKCTALDMAPSMLSVIFKLSGDSLSNYKDQLDYIELGSAPLVEEDKRHLCELLPNTRLYNFYGSTESGRTCALNFNDGVERPSCIGLPTQNAKFIFVDKERNEITATKENPGFIATGGSMNMKEYLNAPKLTAKAVENGFIYTNDLGYKDKEGYIYCLGREDDVINCAGIKISPDEIENIAKKFEGIADCACVPALDKMQGQVPKLFISVSIPKDKFDMMAYREFLKNNLDSNKYPKIVEFIDVIPRTSNGKLQRKKLLAL
ncbi:MAG: acyl--CoA ligase [Lachnospiraceae bacterium]|nr:acyl--CoA ligase [Lachnospiraceae bacterium]